MDYEMTIEKIFKTKKANLFEKLNLFILNEIIVPEKCPNHKKYIKLKNSYIIVTRGRKLTDKEEDDSYLTRKTTELKCPKCNYTTEVQILSEYISDKNGQIISKR